MTTLLKKAFSKAQQLPDEEQDRLASFLMAEMESEQKWSEGFAKSQDELSILAKEALAEYKRGETEPLDDEP
jgi:hypothetical protein